MNSDTEDVCRILTVEMTRSMRLFQQINSEILDAGDGSMDYVAEIKVFGA